MIQILLALALTAFAQQARVGTDRFAGYNDTDSPAIIDPSEAQSALNVESNIQGTAILKRRGYNQTAALTYSTSAVNGAHNFIDRSGNLQVIVCHDRVCQKSTNNGAFSALYSTATAGVFRWSFVDLNGTVYAVNDKNDQPFSWDGTTFTQPFSTSVPNGSLIELSKDRLIISGVTAKPNRVYYSQSGAYGNFATGINQYDAWTDDMGTPGDKVTALKYEGGNLYIFKRQSILICNLFDQYSTSCSPLSNVIGTNSPSSIVSAPDGIYFQSQNGSYWRIPYYGINGLELVSKKISNLVASQPSQFGNTGYNVQGSMTDWAAGVQNPLSSWNITNHVGAIFNSSVTLTDNTQANFSSGTFNQITATDVSNSISLSSITFRDTFSAGNYTTLPTSWTATSGNPTDYRVDTNLGLSAVTDGLPGIYTVGPGTVISSGSWRLNFYYTTALANSCQGAKTYCFDFRFAKAANGDFYSLRVDDQSGTSDKRVRIFKSVSSVETVLTSYTTFSVPAATTVTLEVQRGRNGNFALLGNGVYLASATADTSVGYPTQKSELLMARDTTNGVTNYISNMRWLLYRSSGVFISRQFDTAYSTPTWGILNSTFTIGGGNNVEGQINFYTQVSTSPNNDMYDSKIAASDTVKIGSAIKRYIRYEADMFTFISTKTPSASAVSLIAATTGQFVTQCIQPGPNITSWGLLTCDTSSNLGNGSVVIYSTSAASCVSITTMTPINKEGTLQVGWAAQTNNAVMTISTNAAVVLGFRSLLGSATDQAQINSCQVNWNNGVLPQSVFGTYDPIKNSIYWTTANNQLGTNNRLLKYDLNLAYQNMNPWFPFDIKATAMRMINNVLNFGSASSGTWNTMGQTSGTGSDNGQAINAYWQSKDFACGSPFQDSQWQRTMAVARNQGGGSVTQTFTNSLGLTDSFSISLSTSSIQNYVRANHNIQKLSPMPFANLKFSNNAANQPFEIDGFQMDCFANPFIPANP